MKSKFILSICFNFLIIVNCFSFDISSYLENYLKKELGFDEVYIDNLKINGNLSDIPDKLQVEKFYGRLLKFSLVLDGKIFDGKAELRAMKKVFVARQDLEKGKVLLEEDVMEKLIEYSKIPRGAITEISSLVGKTLKSSLKSNSVLTDSKLVTVRKGETVTIKIERPNFSIKMKGKALEDGNEGKLIRVLNFSSNKFIKGMVQDDKTINLDF